MARISKRRRHARSASSSAATATNGHHGFHFNKRHGQHILRNPRIADAIVSKSAIRATDTVLEVGAGTGNLTVRLLPLCKRLIAYELDARMVVELSKRVQASALQPRLQLLHADVLQAQPLPRFDVCVANTPYHISSPLLFRLLAHRPRARALVLMLQREFAQRLSARAGDVMYCRLSVNVQLLARVSVLLSVAPNNFRPPPRVHSSVVRIEPRWPPPTLPLLEWDAMLRVAFQRKHRMLRACFTHNKVLRQLLERRRQRGAQPPPPPPPPPPQSEQRALENMAQRMLHDEPQLHELHVEPEQHEERSQAVQLEALKEEVLHVLQQNHMLTKRAAQLHVQQFEQLLHAFHQHNIYFSLAN